MVENDVREFFGDKVYRTVIPRNVRVSEAPSFGLPAIVYDMKSPGATAYIHLASEVLKRERTLMREAAANEQQLIENKSQNTEVKGAA
jgi:chromosome partitioning protein